MHARRSEPQPSRNFLIVESTFWVYAAHWGVRKRRGKKSKSKKKTKSTQNQNQHLGFNFFYCISFNLYSTYLHLFATPCWIKRLHKVKAIVCKLPAKGNDLRPVSGASLLTINSQLQIFFSQYLFVQQIIKNKSMSFYALLKPSCLHFTQLQKLFSFEKKVTVLVWNDMN